MRTNFSLLLAAVFLLLAAPTLAQEAVSDDEVNEVAKGLYCPVCESEPLDTCPTQACIDWREEIRAQLAAGRTKQEIYDLFLARYGSRVLAQPPARGGALLLWLAIPAGLLVGGLLFARYLRSISGPEPRRGLHKPAIHLNGNHPEIDDKYLRRIEEELNE